MMNMNIFPSGNCPVENITGVWRFQRPARFHGKASSIPGHLLHYIISGSYKLKIGAKQYYPQKGDMLYYYGNEDVLWEGDDSDVDFYSVGFMGTSIPVLSPENRIIKSPQDQKATWDKLWDASNSSHINKGSVMSYAILLEILAPVFWNEEKADTLKNSRKWQKIEKLIRSEKLYHISPEQLAEKVGHSRTSLYNIYRNDMGSTPLQRIKKIRMEEAKGLLKFTDMRVGEISDFLGYNRIHDFSREFKKETGFSPRDFRE